MHRLKNNCKLVSLIAGLIFSAVIFTLTARGQSGSQGSVIVTVQDPTGNLVPGAHLELIDVSTNDIRLAETQDRGSYTFVNLNIGTYRLTVSKSGFAQQVFESVIIHSAQVTDVNASLRIGQESQTVQVTESATPVLETSSNAIGTVVDMKQIQDLPVADRDLSSLALITPGYNGTWNGLPSIDQGSNIDGVMGSPSRMKFTGNASPAVTARLEDIEEMTIQTDQLALNSGFGQSSMQINFVTKRGSNHFHGGVFGDFQNSGLNANSWTNNAADVRKDKFIKNSFGANAGGPILHDKLFFFGSFAFTKEPATITAFNNVFTQGAQSGNFTYIGSDGQSHTENLFQLAQQTNPSLPTTLNSAVSSQLQTINKSLSGGSVSSSSDPNFSTVRWNVASPTTYYFPTVRVDYSLSQKLRMYLAWNMTQQTQPSVNPPNFPGSDFSDQTTGNWTRSYIASYGLDWIISPSLINQFKAGFLYNATKYSYNAKPLYATEPTVAWNFNSYGSTSSTCNNNGMSGQCYQTPIGPYYPVFNASDSVTWQHGAHNFDFGFSWYREQDHYWNGPLGFPAYNLGLSTGDPALQAFNATTLPGASTHSQAEAQQLYAVLTGRIGGGSGTQAVNGTFAYNPSTGSYFNGIGSYNLNELSKAWGVFFEDSWHVTPNFTLNYGLRWDFTGDNHDLTGAYHSVSPSGIFGPSGIGNLFNPGSLQGDMNPQIITQPHAYSPWNVSPQPAIGFAWNPKGDEGVLGKLFGDGKTVIRGGFNLRRFTEPYQYFWDAASDYAAFFYQTFYLNANNTGQSGTFTPGSLALGGNLPAYGLAPATYQKSEALSDFTFQNSVGTNGINPGIKQPYSQAWNFGIQRQLGNSRAIEIRYNGNRTVHQWLNLNPNEVNIFENGFLNEFKNAQTNLALNGGTSFAYNGMAGQKPLPIFNAAFAGESSGGPGVPLADYSNSQFITYLQTGQAGAMANVLAGVNGTAPYFCNLVGSSFAPCVTNAGYTGGGAGYPINFFQANPYAAGTSTGYMTAAGYSNYNALQVDFRQNAWSGLQFDANYTWSQSLGLSTYNDWTSAFAAYTLRDLAKSYGPSLFDLHNVFHFSGTYDLPFGAGKPFLSSGHLVDKMLGNWTAGTILTFQSGAPWRLTGGYNTFNDYGDGGIVLNGVTSSQLQHSIGVHHITPAQNGGTPATFVDFIDPKYLASPTGGANPTFITPNTTPGTFGSIIYLHQPHTFQNDVSLTKAFPIKENLRVRFQGEFLNAWNHPLFGNGGSGNTYYNGNIQGTSFGTGTELNQFTTPSYTPRQIELRVNVDF
ncbi:TonB-dependent receptor [Alloacidobacterium dinghuense]|uniref:TonB-dependent receptor n=1 Tax=Alloacidobacterium dinghuense TaxID=2763107 RepID=A0A7G8BLW1_9BACT|nr:carboxypeptidase-like regulatory domain-containing protein [Alloacidobacterium dinghuense]QNI33531.1 TonB-dependent receptor [Alloacidobacterium dinghuense]